MRVAHEQLPAEVLFQAPDMVAHRGLADLELAARLGEAVPLRDDEKGLEEERIEHGAEDLRRGIRKFR